MCVCDIAAVHKIWPAHKNAREGGREREREREREIYIYICILCEQLNPCSGSVVKGSRVPDVRIVIADTEATWAAQCNLFSRWT